MSNLPNGNELKYFIEVAKSKNFTRASERLGISQPALTISMKKLEIVVGGDLFLRSKSGVQLTKLGEKFFQQSLFLIDHWENLLNSTKNDLNSISGRFRIGAHQTVFLDHLIPTTTFLLSRHSNIDFECIHDLSRNITENIISYKIDIGLVVNPVRHPDLVIIPIKQDVVTFFKHKNCKNLDVLIMEPSLLQTQSLLKKIKKNKINFKRTVTSSSLEVIRELVFQGAGIGIMPTSITSHKNYESIIKAFKNAPDFVDEIAIVYRNDMKKGLAFEAILSTLKKELKK